MQTVLYIGGVAQGKYALAQKIHGKDAPYVLALQALVKEALHTGEDPMLLLPKLYGRIVLCDEIGYGVVPLDPFERAWREATGRLCCAIAEKADLVVRVIAGIPQVIKGTLP